MTAYSDILHWSGILTLIQFLTLLPNLTFSPNARPKNICNGCGMTTEDASSSGNLIMSLFGTCKRSNVETNIKHPSVLLFSLHMTFATDAACQQRTLAPPHGLSCAISDLHVFLCWGHSLLKLVIFPDFEFRTSLGTSFFFWIYDMPGIALCMDVLLWGRHDFLISFSNMDTSRSVSNRHWRTHMVDSGSYQTIWSYPLKNYKWNSVTWPCAMTTLWQPSIILFRDLITKLDLLPSYERFLYIIYDGLACRQGTHTPPDTWSVLFGTCICSSCWDQSFSRTFRYFFGLFTSNIPRYFLNFASLTLNVRSWPETVV